MPADETARHLADYLQKGRALRAELDARRKVLVEEITQIDTVLAGMPPETVGGVKPPKITPAVPKVEPQP